MFDIAYPTALFLVLVALLFILYIILQWKLGHNHNVYHQVPQTQLSNQQEDIFNISSRVQGQWPTHDRHVSMDHFTITNETNKDNDLPPTYEEAIRIEATHNAPVQSCTTVPTSTST